MKNGLFDTDFFFAGMKVQACLRKIVKNVLKL